MYEFYLGFPWNFFLGVQITLFQQSIGSDTGVAPSRRQVIIWANDGYFTDAYMRLLASMS